MSSPNVSVRGRRGLVSACFRRRYSAASAGGILPRPGIFARGARAEHYLAAVVAQEQPVAMDRDRRADRVVDVEFRSVHGYRNPAARVFDDQCFVEFSVEVVARHHAFDRDVLRDGGLCSRATRFERSDRDRPLRRVVEFQPRRLVAPGEAVSASTTHGRAECRAGYRREPVNGYNRFHRAV